MEEQEQYRTNVSEPSIIEEPAKSLQEDKVLWRDKGPLALALLAQSYVVFLWYFHSTHGIHPDVDFVIALAAGIALDWLTVSTVMGRREGRTSIWSWLTSFGAFLGSAMIAYDTYAAQWWPIDGKALLHMCYPLVVLLYSLHLSSPRRPKNVKAISYRSQYPLPLLGFSEDGEKPPATSQERVAVTAAPQPPFNCPHCDAGLESIGELGAAKRWGHCRNCKASTSTTIPLAYTRDQAWNENVVVEDITKGDES